MSANIAIISVVLFAGYGLAVGVLFGFFGMGGFLVTPALLVSGYDTRVAVGSGLAFVFGTSLIATIRHRDLGQVNRRLGVALFVSATAGIALGRHLVAGLSEAGIAGAVVSTAYVVLLLGVGAFVYRDADADEGGSATRIAARVRAVSLPPTAATESGRVSLVVVLAVGLVVGVLAGMLGVGGGFLLVPALVYGLGLAAPVAVGTNVFQMTVSAAYGTVSYASGGFVALPVVLALLVGSTLGARVGSAATNHVDEDDIKGAFAAVLVGGGLAVASKHLAGVLGVAALRPLGQALLFGSGVIVSAVVVARFLAALRSADANERATA
ncbi:MAG: sulfite exporter TauE/SafE family protein [Halanaeroarchaeum sp.]